MSTAAGWFQPRHFPEDQTPGLAPVMSASVAARVEVHRLINPASADWKDRVAGLVRSFIDLKPLAAECEHLRHERHAVQLPVGVERPQDFLFASHFHPVADA